MSFLRSAVFSLALPLTFLLAGCSSNDDGSAIRARYDATVNYRALRSFDWGSGSDMGPYSATVREAIAEQMNDRGAKLIPGSGETVLSHYLMMRRPDGTLPEGRALGYVDTQGKPATLEPARVFMADRVAAAHEGLVIIDLVDRASGRLMWRSMALTTIDPGLSPADQRAHIDRTMKELFARYPVKG